MENDLRLKKNRLQRENRKRNGNISTHKYEKTPRGFLMRLYRNMDSRINGVQKKKWHLYKGKDILPKEDFYKWALNSVDFYCLFADWYRSGYDQKLTPSVDRIDSSKGYTVDNMRWLTHSQNSRLGGKSKSSFVHPPVVSNLPLIN